MTRFTISRCLAFALVLCAMNATTAYAQNASPGQIAELSPLLQTLQEMEKELYAITLTADDIARHEKTSNACAHEYTPECSALRANIEMARCTLAQRAWRAYLGAHNNTRFPVAKQRQALIPYMLDRSPRANAIAEVVMLAETRNKIFLDRTYARAAERPPGCTLPKQ